MKRFILSALLVLVAVCASGQVKHKIPSVDSNNVWTGNNDFRGTVTCNGVPCAGGAPAEVNGQDISPKSVNGVMAVTTADATGTNDSTAAIQAVVNAARSTHTCVLIPPGTYKLSTPVQVSSGDCIGGVNGVVVGAGGTTLKPNTAAFVTAAPLSQLQNITIKDLYFVGGTNVIDLGAFHLVNLYDLFFQDYSGWAISHVRGERHEIRNITCWHHTVAAQGCISVADPTKSLFASTYAGASWNDQWFDRCTIDHVFDMGDSSVLTDQYVLWANGGAGTPSGSFSNCNVRWLMAHQAGQSGLMRQYNVQMSEFHNMATDLIGTEASPVPSVIDIGGYFKHSTIEGFYPKYSGNSHFTTGAFFEGLFYGSTVKNCTVGGDNLTTYGLRFGINYAHFGEIIACEGSLYHESLNALWRNQIAVTGSTMTPNNASGGVILNDRTAQDIVVQLADDGGGTAAASNCFKVIHATGSGNNMVTFKQCRTETLFNTPLTIPAGIQIQNSPLSTTGDINSFNGKTLNMYSDSGATSTVYVNGATGQLSIRKFYLVQAEDPASGSACSTSEVRISSGYLYSCSATNTWKRVALMDYYEAIQHYKRQTVSTGSIAGSSAAVVTLTWTDAFADADYAPTCEIVEATLTGATLRKHHITAIAADSVSVLVVNDDTAAHTGTLSCTATK